jgi:hypothetical protein
VVVVTADVVVADVVVADVVVADVVVADVAGAAGVPEPAGAVAEPVGPPDAGTAADVEPAAEPPGVDAGAVWVADVVTGGDVVPLLAGALTFRPFLPPQAAVAASTAATARTTGRLCPHVIVVYPPVTPQCGPFGRL